MTIKTTDMLREALRLLRPYWFLAMLATTAGTLGGLATAWLLAVVNRNLHAESAISWATVASFVVLCLLSVSGTAIAGAANSIIGQKLIAALRQDISARILRAPIATLEAYRTHRLMATLTNDVDTVSAFTFNFSGYAIAFAVTLGSFVYLLILSRPVFLISLGSVVIGVMINIIAKQGWIRDYEKVRVAQDDLHKQYRAIIDGAKELKISRPRRVNIYGVQLAGAADKIATLKSRAMQLFWLADACGSAIFFAVIGLLLTVQHWLGISASAISGAVIVLLYVKGPIAQLAAALPIFDQARVSFQRVVELSAEFGRGEPNLQIFSGEHSPESKPQFDQIEFRQVRYAFPSAGGSTAFVLGPIDLTVRAGELLFIVGENGSGKTTLIKLLLGIYAPQGGQILLDGIPVTAAGRDDYRQLFTTVFADYYLFDDLIHDSTLPQNAQVYLERLNIADKVTIRDGRFSTIDLSTGQRKRLALVHAYLENRPIIVTDEWAADQDPSFRHLFYTQLLPELKAEGKTLIVVSHDDRYFDVADRIIGLENGRLVEAKHPAERNSTLATSARS